MTVPVSRKSELREAGFNVDQLGLAGTDVILDVSGPCIWVDALDFILPNQWPDYTVAQFLTGLLGNGYAAGLAVRVLASDI